MILLFLIVLLFVIYVVVFSYKDSKFTSDKYVFYLSCILIILSFLVYLIKREKIVLSFSLSAYLALSIGPLLLMLLKEKRERIYLHFIPLLFFLVIHLNSILLFPAFCRWYSPFLNKLLFGEGMLSCLIYGSYGYLYVVKKELSIKRDSLIISYIVFVFSCAFFCGILFFKTPKLLDIDYIYMFYCFFILGVVLFNEVSDFKTFQKMKEEEEADLIQYFIEVEDKYGMNLCVKEVREAETLEESEIKEELKQRRNDHIRQVLSVKLIDSKLYLDPDLTLDKLSKIADLSKKELTAYFKGGQSNTFKQYINRLKVEYAVNLIKEKNKDITVEELAYHSGFNTRLSFYRAFVNLYGFPPSAFLDK